MKREANVMPRRSDFLSIKSPRFHTESGWSSPYASSRSPQKTKKLTLLLPSKLPKLQVSAPGSRCSSPSARVPFLSPPQPESSSDSPLSVEQVTRQQTGLLEEQVRAFQKYQRMLDPANKNEGKSRYLFVGQNSEYETKTREMTEMLKFTWLEKDRKSCTRLELLAKENAGLASELALLKTKLQLALHEQADLQSQYQARTGFRKLEGVNIDKMRRLSLPESLDQRQGFPRLTIPNRDLPNLLKDRQWTYPPFPCSQRTANS